MVNLEKNSPHRTGIVIGMVGLIGSGKDTAADYLVNSHQFRRDSFASTLKDAVSAVFGWDREMLEGRTAHSREWREQVDEWWAARLGIPHLTPRWILQHWGTEVCRNGFHDDIWIASLENKLRSARDNIVISDVRFPNEIKAIKNVGGIVVRIKRGEDPSWFKYAKDYNAGPTHVGWSIGKNMLSRLGIHSSEYSWVGEPVDFEVSNDQTIDDLFSQLRAIVMSGAVEERKMVLDLL